MMVSPLNGAETPVGAHAKNTGGKKGRSGRRPNDVLKWLESLYGEDEVREQLEAVLKDRDHPHWARAFFSGLEQVRGKATQRLEVKNVTPQQESGEAAVARLTEALPRLLLIVDTRAKMLKDVRAKEEIVIDAKET